jgi:hypothetical protein
LGSTISLSRNHVRTVLRDRPVCLHISLIDCLSRKYKRRIFANVPTLITPVSPVHNFVRTELLTGVKFRWKKLPSGGQFWVAFNKLDAPPELVMNFVFEAQYVKKEQRRRKS